MSYYNTYTATNSSQRPCKCCANMVNMICTNGACLSCHNMGLCHHG